MCDIVHSTYEFCTCRIQGMWLLFDIEYIAFGGNYTVFVNICYFLSNPFWNILNLIDVNYTD